jgi:hypothetical protein
VACGCAVVLSNIAASGSESLPFQQFHSTLAQNLVRNTKIPLHEVKALWAAEREAIARNIPVELSEKFLSDIIGGTHIYH